MILLRQFKEAVRSSILKRVVGLYGLHIVNYAFPLFVIPHLARVMGPATWGTFAFVDGIARLISFFVEYGFHLSATREVAQHRHDPGRTAHIVSSVIMAQAFLTAIAVLAVGAAVAFTVLWQQHAALLIGGLWWAIAQAANPIWCFQGLEEMLLPSLIDISAKTLQLASIIFFVQRPEDAWRVLGIQAIAATLSTAGGYFILCRSLSLPRPVWAQALARLRDGLTIFFYRTMVMLYTTANVVILGLMLSPSAVGYFAGAERICRAAIGLLHPLNQAFFPRINHQVHHDPLQALRTIRLTIAIMFSYGLVIMTVLWLAAPHFVRLMLGPHYEASIGILRMMAIVAPLNALSNALGLQWMIPHRMDRTFQWIIAAGATANICLAFVLVPNHGGIGMTWAIVASEFTVVTCIMLVLYFKGANPLWPPPAASRAS